MAPLGLLDYATEPGDCRAPFFSWRRLLMAKEENARNERCGMPKCCRIPVIASRSTTVTRLSRNSAGRMRKHRIRILAGDKVSLENISL
jgi:hypothetical protein